jgi:formylglycine-generating enzyme required for sulfatase activity/tRNA A-37 threonylcarbamoyl transferase component Bud32
MLLNNRYHVLEQLGRGGFGVTYLTEDAHLPSRRKCVVKKFQPHLYNDTAEVRERFRQEARVLERLGRGHDQIPELYAFFEEDGGFYLVQEYVPGKTLRQLLKGGAKFDEAAVRKFLCELLPVVDYVHQNRVIHRDIKPDNIIIRETDGKPTLIDFGLVKEMMDSHTVSKSVGVGTMGFMAFEQMQGHPLPASDVYAVGMTAIAALTGGVALKPDSQTGQLSWKPIVGNRVGGELATTLDRATALLAHMRYKNAGEMLAALERPAYFVNAIGMEFVLVSAGKFVMGSTEADERRWNEFLGKYGQNANYMSRERPAHEVTIGAPFYLGKYPVTQGEWKAVMGSNPSSFKGDDRLPVEQVSWNDCQEFIGKLNARKDGYVYRLPSEAEWEYACRAGTTGDYAGELDALGWCADNSGDKRLDAHQAYTDAGYDGSKYYGTFLKPNNCRTHAVGQKGPNGFGVYDMHGNVWEWCQDGYHENYNGAPTDGRAWETGSDNKRILRGGSWGYIANSCRSAIRNYNAPDDRYYNFIDGFRLVAARIP